MILYHWTKKENLSSILKEGLKPNGFGIVYLTPEPDWWRGEICLKVETRDLTLSSFEDCKDWEILCWGHIPPQDIMIV